jgi:hypothetical protein
VSIFADRGCGVVSATDPRGRILGSLGRGRKQRKFDKLTNYQETSKFEKNRKSFLEVHVNVVKSGIDIRLHLVSESFKNLEKAVQIPNKHIKNFLRIKLHFLTNYMELSTTREVTRY